MRSRFQAGGTLRPGKFYIRRDADDELAKELLTGEFCYILGPRQIGKSSLCTRTISSLKESGVRCASIDLSEVGTIQTAAEWYKDLAHRIADQLELPMPAHAERAAPAAGLQRYLKQVALQKISGPIVLFFDEIEFVRALPFSASDFFAMIRSLYNQRGTDPECERLAFCLLGVATPADLVDDSSPPPLNIGKRIALSDFTASEAMLFLDGLRGLPGDALEWLEAIIAWTAGHPYMTQALCAALCSDPDAAQGRDRSAVIMALVEHTILQRPLSNDPALSYAATYFSARDAGYYKYRLLELYERLLQGERVTPRLQDLVHLKLLTTGLVAERGVGPERVLQVRNRIFARVFDQRWVRQALLARHLSPHIDVWRANGRSKDYLLRGQLLEDAQAWARERRDLTEEEKTYLQRSTEVTERSNRTQRNVAIAIGSLLVLVLVLVVIVLLGQASQTKLETALADCLAGDNTACRSAFERSESRCRAGRTDGCVKLARLYERGYGVLKDIQHALQLYTESCARDDGEGCNNVGYYFEKGREPLVRDEAKAVVFYEKACRLRHSVACANLGLFYERGLGVVRDLGRATVLYRTSCEAGASYGCNNLGNLYHHGIGVPADLDRAAELYASACDKQAGLGCVNAGFLQEQAQRWSQARASYQRACDLSAPKGCTSLGHMLSQGLGVPADKRKAAGLYRWACEAAFEPDSRACNNLGVLYENGAGVDRNTFIALYQYDRSCRMGYFDACKNRDELRDRTDLRAKLSEDSAVHD